MSSAKDSFVEATAGSAIFKEGDTGGEMYIIESGEIEIVRKARGSEAMALLGPGDFFGEMAILEDQPRFASAIAKTNARLLRIERAAFADVLKQNVEIAVRIMRKLEGRQRRSEQRLQEVLAELAKLKSAVVSAPSAAAPAAKPATQSKPTVEPTPKAAPSGTESRARVPASAPAMSTTSAQNLALRHAASGQVLALDVERSEFLVGRPDPVTGTQPEINLGPFDSGRTLSRRHAKILKEGGLYFVREEVGTTNGTFVNDERIKTGVTVPLKAGDTLRFGSIQIDLVPA